MELSSRSEDFREGLAAFVDKRPGVHRPVSPSPSREHARGRGRRGGAGLVRDTVPAAWRAAAEAGRPLREVRGFAEYQAWYPRSRRRPGGAHLADGLRRPRPAPGAGAPAGARAGALRGWAGSTRWASTCARRAVRPRHTRPSGCATCRASSTPARRGASSSARSGVRPGLAGHPGRAGRRRLGADRPEGVDHLGARVRPGGVPGPHRPGVPKRAGITYFLVDMHAPASTCGRCATSRARSTSTRCSSTRCAYPTTSGSGPRAGAGGGQRHAVGRAPDGVGRRVGGVDRIGGSGADALLAWPGAPAGGPIRCCRRRVVGLWAEERIRAGPTPGCGPACGRARGPELDRQGAPGRPQPAHPAGCVRPAGAAAAWDPGPGAGAQAAPRCGACCAAGPTPSRAAPAR